VLGLAPETAESDATLAGALADRQSLLVLDDLDALLLHDRQGLVGMMRALLGTRFLKLLTTARLDLPGRIHHAPLELTCLTGADAQTAFLTYAPPIEKWGEWTPDEWRDLLRFLDGYPFPIRLAATAMRVARLSLRDLWRRLQANPQGTLRYPGDEEDRETSLAATLDLSYNVLPAAAQRAFALLALFPAGLTRDAAQTIAGIEAETHRNGCALRHGRMARHCRLRAMRPAGTGAALCRSSPCAADAGCAGNLCASRAGILRRAD
jgi:predicted ATPase